MIALPAGSKVWLAAGATDMRKGFDGLAALMRTQLTEDPFSGQLFVFRGRAGDRGQDKKRKFMHAKEPRKDPIRRKEARAVGFVPQGQR